MKPRECPSAAVLPCCLAAAQAYTQTPLWTCCCQAYRQTPRWTAANSPHECTRVRCDASGSGLSQLFFAPSTRCKAGLGAVATDDAPCPPHAAVKKKPRQEHFAGRFRKGTGCLSRRTTPVRFKNDTCPLLCVSWHRQHCRHRCEAKTSCGTVHQEPRCARDGLHGQRGRRGQPGLRTLGDFTGLLWPVQGEHHHETARLCVLPDRVRPHAEDTARPPLS
jgi:hypothetical protein